MRGATGVAVAEVLEVGLAFDLAVAHEVNNFDPDFGQFVRSDHFVVKQFALVRERIDVVSLARLRMFFLVFVNNYRGVRL